LYLYPSTVSDRHYTQLTGSALSRHIYPNIRQKLGHRFSPLHKLRQLLPFLVDGQEFEPSGRIEGHRNVRGTDMSLKTKPFDAAEYLDDPDSQAELLSDAFESGDAGYIAQALGVVARARGMTEIAREAGVTREALYKALTEEGDPRLSTLLGVTRALGVTLSAAPATAPKRGSRARTRAPSRGPAA
jgi:probable addiction module antidote protein